VRRVVGQEADKFLGVKSQRSLGKRRPCIRSWVWRVVSIGEAKRFG
jgi:hypothetical protein